MSKRHTEKGFSDSIKTRSENFNIRNKIKSPFDGLMANKLECMNCGFSEGIIHSLFTSVSLPLSSKELCSLEDCLSAYVNKEIIEDILCQKCSLIASKSDLEILLKSLPDSEISRTIKKKLNAIISALETEVLDAEYLKEFKLPRLVNTVKSKQIMFARLPKILTLHINRSTISPINGSIYKNTASITFPLILDLNKYTTSYSNLWIDPLQTMSVDVNQKNPLKYELKSIIVHYGSHTSGHYITFRKTPKGWFKISDRNVWACTIEEVLQSGNVFMLMYEEMKNTLNKYSPFLSFIENVSDFDQKLESYIIESISNTDNFYARYTKTILCASMIQESITACNLTAENSRPVCASTCVDWTNSQAFILQYYCTNRTLENDLSLIRADFALCTSPSQSFSLDCVKGLCQYCNSFSQNSMDMCCIVSNLSQCTIFNYSDSLSLPSCTRPNFTEIISPNTTDSDSLHITSINKDRQEEKDAGVLPRGTISFIIIFSIIIIFIILSLLILLIILSCNRRKKNKNIPSEQPSNLNQHFIRKHSSHKNNILSFFETSNSNLNYNTTLIEKDSDYFNRIVVTVPEKGHPQKINEDKQTKRINNLYNISDLNKNYKLSQNASLNLSSYRTLNHHASQITENNAGSINTNAFKSSRSRPASSVGEDRTTVLPVIMSIKDYYSDHQITRNTEVVALYMYEPKMPDEMTLERGDIIYVVSVWDDGWCSGIKIGKINNFNSKKNSIKYLEDTINNISESKTKAQTDELIIKVFPLIIKLDISPSSTLKSAPPNITHKVFYTSENNISSQLNEKNMKFKTIGHDIKLEKEIRRKSFPGI
ncbi:hypothetical protein PMAC_000835 [Pneumocystis sp. 'macacae']|nr:hypothetical protein PMAC_000835 [Pneumocystis sp. 'macacae']